MGHPAADLTATVVVRVCRSVAVAGQARVVVVGWAAAAVEILEAGTGEAEEGEEGTVAALDSAEAMVAAVAAVEVEMDGRSFP